MVDDMSTLTRTAAPATPPPVMRRPPATPPVDFVVKTVSQTALMVAFALLGATIYALLQPGAHHPPVGLLIADVVAWAVSMGTDLGGVLLRSLALRRRTSTEATR